MWKLIRLEYKKNKTGKYILKASLLLVCLLFFFYAFTYLGIAIIDGTGEVEADVYGRLTEVVTGFVEVLYLILTGSMYASFIVEAYRKKTMHLMFMYPVRRYKILLAQILAVWIFSICAQMITKAAVFDMLAAVGLFMTPDFLLDFNLADWRFWWMQIISSVLVATMSLIALWAGVRRRSTRMALIAALVLVLIKKGNIGGLSLRSIGWVPFALAAFAVLITVIALWNADKKDVPDF